MRNTPYIHQSHDSILELWQDFPECYILVTQYQVNASLPFDPLVQIWCQLIFEGIGILRLTVHCAVVRRSIYTTMHHKPEIRQIETFSFYFRQNLILVEMRFFNMTFLFSCERYV